MPTNIEIARIAAAINLLRPDWPTKSLQTLIEKRHADRPYLDVVVALAFIAADPDTRTPARLDEDGPWWRATRPVELLPLPPLFRAVVTHKGTPPPGDFRERVEAAKQAAREARGERVYHEDAECPECAGWVTSEPCPGCDPAAAS